MSEWISVNDKTPHCEEHKWSEPVIAMCDAGLIYKLSYFGSKQSGVWQRTACFVNNVSKRITHWMPLPAPTEDL